MTRLITSITACIKYFVDLVGPDNLNLKELSLQEPGSGQMINWEAVCRILFALFSGHRVNRMCRVFFR